jgi:hypothetical protein
MGRVIQPQKQFIKAKRASILRLAMSACGAKQSILLKIHRIAVADMHTTKNKMELNKFSALKFWLENLAFNILTAL